MGVAPVTEDPVTIRRRSLYTATPTNAFKKDSDTFVAYNRFSRPVFGNANLPSVEEPRRSGDSNGQLPPHFNRSISNGGGSGRGGNGNGNGGSFDQSPFNPRDWDTAPEVQGADSFQLGQREKDLQLHQQQEAYSQTYSNNNNSNNGNGNVFPDGRDPRFPPGSSPV